MRSCSQIIVPVSYLPKCVHVLVPTLNLNVNITIELFMYLLSDIPSEVSNIKRIRARSRHQ